MSDAPVAAQATPSRWIRILNSPLPVALVFLYLAFLFGRVHLGTEGLYERDGYFHARFAQQFADQGLSRSFPYTQFSTWKEQFCDKEFLFHTLMWPFARPAAEPLAGVRVFMLLLDLAFCLAAYLILRRNQVPAPWAFVFLLACLGGPFLIRLTMIRSHVLSMILAVIGVHLLIGKRWKWLLALGFLYAWSYTVPLVLVMIAVPFALGAWWAGGGLDWKSPAAAMAGVVLGLIIHPFSPQTLETFATYLDVISMGAQGKSAAALELGKEIYPYSTRSFLHAFPLWTALVLALPLLALRIRTAIRPETLGALTAALAWFGMTLLFSRFMEYAIPLFVLALGLLVRDWSAGLELRERFAAAHPRAAVAAGAGVALVLSAFHALSADFYLASQRELPPPRFAQASSWMARNLESGETVVNLWWDDFPELYYSAPRQRYLVGLDPTYMLRFDAEKARLLEAMRTQRAPLDGPLLARTFGARYMILRADVARTYPELGDRTWGYVYKDEHAVIYALDGPEGRRVPARAGD
ncbi:MAG: hypothetical protein HS116_20035 [Planctomycetes bacterium]|nr:hypothetical protein [Planctomycetota bacterium]